PPPRGPRRRGRRRQECKWPRSSTRRSCRLPNGLAYAATPAALTGSAARIRWGMGPPRQPPVTIGDAQGGGGRRHGKRHVRRKKRHAGRKKRHVSSKKRHTLRDSVTRSSKGPDLSSGLLAAALCRI